MCYPRVTVPHIIFVSCTRFSTPSLVTLFTQLIFFNLVQHNIRILLYLQSRLQISMRQHSIHTFSGNFLICMLCCWVSNYFLLANTLFIPSCSSYGVFCDCLFFLPYCSTSRTRQFFQFEFLQPYINSCLFLHIHYFRFLLIYLGLVLYMYIDVHIQ